MAITGFAEAEALGNVKVFQAGTTIENGQTVSTGGRVLCVTALDVDLAAAQKRAYEALKHVKMDNAYYRKDIGFKGLQ
jgi:phosphoribosylamine--glycine ligase